MEAHALVRKILTHSGDINPTVPGYLEIVLDPLPTGRETAVAAELCEHLTATETRFPGTERILRFAIKKRTQPQNEYLSMIRALEPTKIANRAPKH